MAASKSKPKPGKPAKLTKADKRRAKAMKIAVGPGPLAPWRLTLSVVCSGSLTGQALVDAVSSGANLDMALGRSFGAAALVWFATGRINRMFVDVERRRLEELLDAPDAFDESDLADQADIAQA